MAYEHDWHGRIEDLEYRLAAYHEQLEDALEHDRQFQMKATWGIVNALLGMGAFFGVLWGAEKLGMEGWLLGTVATLAAFIAYGVAFAWSDKGREGDLKKLSRLPKWKGKWRE